MNARKPLPTLAVAELARIQKELKAPKDQFNKFGGYHYRTTSGILEGVKKVAGECAVAISDKIVDISGRFYVEATATLVASDGTMVSVTAYAREADDKKGMDSAQVTGATSSYARKYALNGLFAIDDTQDSDAINSGEDTKPKASGILISKEQAATLREKLNSVGADVKQFENYMGYTLDEMPVGMMAKAEAAIEKKRKAAKPSPAAALETMIEQVE